MNEIKKQAWLSRLYEADLSVSNTDRLNYYGESLEWRFFKEVNNISAVYFYEHRYILVHRFELDIKFFKSRKEALQKCVNLMRESAERLEKHIKTLGS